MSQSNNLHIRIVSYLLIIGGVALIALLINDFVLDAYQDWLVLGIATFPVLAGLMFGRAGLIGRVMVRVVSVMALLYSAAWLFMGGMDDALDYWPGIIIATLLAIYALIVARTEARAT